MCFHFYTTVLWNAALAQREQDAVQREQAARQAHAQKRASVGDKLQRVSDIQYWGQANPPSQTRNRAAAG